MPISCSPIRQNNTLIKVATLAVGLIGAAQAQADTPTDKEGWHTACNGSPLTTERTGRITTDAIRSGLNILSEHGEATALDDLSVEEGCLSIVASDYTQRSTVVLKKGIRHDVGVPAAIIKSNPLMAEQASLAYKLDKLNIDVLPESMFNGATYRKMAKIDPEAAKGHLNLAISVDLIKSPRSASYTQNTNGTCLIALAEGNALNEFDRRTTGSIGNGLSQADRDWLNQYGSSLEYWHEASHCLAPNIMQESIKTTEMGEHIAGQGGSCNTVPQKLGVIEQNMEQDSIKKTLLDAQANQNILNGNPDQTPGPAKPSPNTGPSENAFDGAQIVRFSRESVMDDLALQVVEKKFPDSVQSCAAPTDPAHPWSKMRVLWSIGSPNTQYLTWLTPWLINESPEVQAQVFADAWSGLIHAKKSIMKKAFYQDWLRQQAAENLRKSMFSSPSGTPDAARSKQWSQWLISQAQNGTHSAQAPTTK